MRSFKSIDEMAAAMGETLGVSDWVIIDQERVDRFAAVTGDRDWTYVDVEQARRELPSKGTLVPGFLLLSLIPVLAAEIYACAGVSRRLNHGLNNVRFPTILPTGTRVRLSAKLIGADKRAGGTQFTYDYAVEVDGADRPACLAEMVTILYP